MSLGFVLVREDKLQGAKEKQTGDKLLVLILIKLQFLILVLYLDNKHYS